jgi:membrane associated rhomboid family serine protease
MKIKWLIPVVFVLLMWVVFIVQLVLNLDVSSLGIYPKDSTTLLGIFTSPLIHGNWNHLISNTLPVLILGMILFVMYEKMALTVWILNYILTGLLVWLFARSSYHIGASGIVYGLASFLLFNFLCRFTSFFCLAYLFV